MYYNTTSILVLIFFWTIGLWGCKKEAITCANQEAFCTAVNNQNFDATGPYVDDFLQGTESEEQLQLLTEWLACKSCVSSASVLCNSCIETHPPISELRVVFDVNGQPVSKTLDILMSDPPQFTGYHD